MKNTTKKVALLLAVVMLAAMLPAMAFAAETEVADAAALQTAIDNSAAGDVIKLTASITTTETTITVPADKNVVLDLNGNTLSGYTEQATSTSFEFIKVLGALTIRDSATGGKITFSSANPGAPMTKNWYSNVISNRGDLTIEGGTIENACASGSAIYAVDNQAGASLTIEGGKLTSTSTTVRMFNWSNSEADKVSFTMTGGEIAAGGGYAINGNFGNAPYVDITISGGTVSTADTTYNLDIYLYMADGGSAANITLNISGGTFADDVAMNGNTAASFDPAKFSISGGEFNEVFNWGDTVAGTYISGGSFAIAPDLRLIEDGYLPAVPADGEHNFEVMPEEQVEAAVDDGSTADGTFYESLADAFAAAGDGEEVRVNPNLPTGTVIEIPEGKTATVFTPNGSTVLEAGKYTATNNGDGTASYERQAEPVTPPTPGRPNPSTGV